MNSESKTTEDLFREMREYADQLDNDGDITGADFRDFANQLEEAMKREKAITDALLACKDKMIPHPDPDNAPPPYFDNAAPRDTHGTTGEGWYGFDLDGTLARYDGWKGIDHIGEPIPAMVSLIKRLYAEGKVVKIMTARVAPRNDTIDGHDARYYVSNWCAKHLGFIPDIVFQKDARMLELYDDRVKQVVPNTGILVENLAAQIGNTGAMRNALERIREKCVIYNSDLAEEIDALCGNALSAPVRNCDVGTAEEQERRYFKLKTEFIDRITKCPHVGYSYFPESLEWAQMPYEAEGGHGVK